MANRMDSIEAPNVIGLSESTKFAEAWLRYNLKGGFNILKDLRFSLISYI